jgi:hypothetical protein
MERFGEIANRRFDGLFDSLKDAHQGQCLYYSVLDGRYVIAEDSQKAAKLYMATYGLLQEGEYREVISNIFPKPKECKRC